MFDAGCEEANLTGVQHEGVYSAHVNGGLFAAMVERGDVAMVNVGHDHINDFCSTLMGIRLCYGGGFGYHAYGLAGWPRRSRQIVLAEDGSYIRTWKRLSEEGGFDKVDEETFLLAPSGLINTTSAAQNTGDFTSQTVLGCGDYGRCNGSVSGFASYETAAAELGQADPPSISYAG
ncbi:hypothetical protein WJX73_007212 [Symbiochloris irregularis]|uniref:Capsule synthesis protein CapA domain-containing protein n=1 Tax=Symbiochloris irregularis TaxID=706552 RepID=A0AAW1PDS9_9CHLO